VDVEDYFQVEAFAGSISRATWDQWPCRVVANTQRVLDLFDEHQAKGTFFFLGWVAERFPELVREVHSRGHELACHSYWHRPIYRLTPDEFRQDTRQAKQVIEDAAGTQVLGYRAPSWSIMRRSSPRSTRAASAASRSTSATTSRRGRTSRCCGFAAGPT